MAVIGYNRLPHEIWSVDQKKRIDKLFSGSEYDWIKKSLSTVRSDLRKSLLLRQKSSCAYCRREIVDEIGKVEIDHVIPKSALPQFTYCRLNLVATCKRCNHRKREHNPLSIKRLNLVNYPVSETSFVWVHPYMHLYNQHIRIDKNGIFRAINGSTKGLAVISVCGLDSMFNVIANQMRATNARAASYEHALASLIANYPAKSDNALARILEERVGADVPFAYHKSRIEAFRAGSFALIRRSRAVSSNSPYAKFLK
ncbi:hypothetical protein CSQ94_11720 [Janthinobacterium sp. BJB312]|nr:hypothetical protein CSQ94_11720 [Janthinobacterium sp. BJB312]